jgi:hypothetical protein
MRISISSEIKQGPWGGGNLFIINLKNYLIKNQIEVVHGLDHKDIDVLLYMDPRTSSETSLVNNTLLKKYLKVYPNTLVVQRINECDQRKGTHFLNNYYLYTSKLCDSVVFVSKWLQELYVNLGMDIAKTQTIYGGANPEVFNLSNKEKYQSGKLKIVTHHWGGNWNKGFDIYKKLDDLLSNQSFSNNFEFTYIGNLPKNFFFKNSKHIKPLDGKKLAAELKTHHIYLTASLNEPSGNHHIEGAQCGLPTLFRPSGGITEHCQNYGLSFETENFETKLLEMKKNIGLYEEKVKMYPLNSDIMSQQYLTLFKTLLKNKQKNKEKFNLSKSRVLDFLVSKEL